MTLIDFVRISRTNILRLIALALVGAGLAFVYASRLPEIYQADASGFIVAQSDQTTGGVYTGTSLAGSKAESYLPLVTSRAVGAGAAEIMGSSESPGALIPRVSPSIATGSTILKVVASGPTPQDAQELADAVVKATAAEANRLEFGGTVPPGATALVRIIPVEAALLPTEPIAPNVRKYVLAGGAAGLGLAYALVFLRRLIDTRLRTSKDVEELTQSSTLGIIPTTNELRNTAGRGEIGSLGVAAESFRQLRTNLRFVSPDAPARSIVITSANAGEGKSTVSSTLARILGEAGESVIIVDADLRRPMLASIFEVDGVVGLSQVLSGQVDQAAALQDTDQANVRLLPAGRTPPNPSELLGSQRMQQLLRELTKNHIVILDAPPLLPVTDAGLLAGMADGAILVFALGKTHKEQAAACAKIMNQVGGKVLGSVLNLAPKKGIGAVMYGDGYTSFGGGSYYDSEDYTNARYRGARGRNKNRARRNRATADV